MSVSAKWGSIRKKEGRGRGKDEQGELVRFVAGVEVGAFGEEEATDLFSRVGMRSFLVS